MCNPLRYTATYSKLRLIKFNEIQTYNSELNIMRTVTVYSQWNTPAATDLIVADYALEGLRRISRAVTKHKYGVCLAQVVNTENKLQADTDMWIN